MSLCVFAGETVRAYLLIKSFWLIHVGGSIAPVLVTGTGQPDRDKSILLVYFISRGSLFKRDESPNS